MPLNLKTTDEVVAYLLGEGYWECAGTCGRMGSSEDHMYDDERGYCMDCQEEA
ncbi:hypothetical protein GCM10028801_31360 [Nocardioides maradonensis]